MTTDSEASGLSASVRVVVLGAVVVSLMIGSKLRPQTSGDTLQWNSAAGSSWSSATNVWYDTNLSTAVSLNTAANRNKSYNFVFSGTGTNSTTAVTSMTITGVNVYANSITFQNNFNATNTTSISDGSSSTNSLLVLGAGAGSSGGTATPWNLTDNATSGTVSFIPTTSTGLLSFSLYASGTISAASGGAVNVSSIINDFDGTHTGGINKTGAGTLTLSGVNSYTGGTTVSAGTLALSGGSNRLSTSGAITAAGGTLDLGGNGQTTNATVSVTGGTIANGTLTQNGGSFDLQAGTVSAKLSGTGALSKSTGGTVTLSGPNDFSGGATVGAGTLTVGHSSALGSAAASVTGGTLAIGSGFNVANNINVGASGTLNGTGTATLTGTVSGNGTLTGALTFGSGGSLSPGNSPGIMQVSGSLTFNSGSTYTWELASLTDNTGGIAGLDFDQIKLLSGGSLVASAGALLPTFTGTATAPSAGTSFWQSAHSWTVVDTSGGGTITSTFVATNNWSVGAFSLSGGTLNWSPSAIPEPSTYAVLLGIAALAGAAWRRRPHHPIA